MPVPLQYSTNLDRGRKDSKIYKFLQDFVEQAPGDGKGARVCMSLDGFKVNGTLY